MDRLEALRRNETERKLATERYIQDYTTGSDYLKFFMEIRDNYVGIVSPINDEYWHLASLPHTIIIRVILKTQREQDISISVVKARLLYDYFEKPVPTGILKYFVTV
jgi:hypothetical protein